LSPWQHEYRLKFDDGTVRWLFGNALPQREADGATLWHGFITDITERKNSEERLRQNEEKLCAYLDNISDTIWLIDANLNMAYVSPSVTRLLGVLPEDLIGRPSALVIHPDDMGIVTNAQRYVMEHTGEPHTVQYRVSHKDGRWIDVESTGVNLLGNPAINGVLVAMRDITERKLAENALRESESRYRLLVESSPLCIHEIDLEGRMQSMNRAGLDMLGLDDFRKVRSLPYLGAVSRQDVERVGALLRDAITNGISSHFEFAAAGAVPQYFKSCFIPIKDASGKVLKLMGITEDITEHKRVEEALRESEASMRAILDNSPYLVWLKDTEGRYITSNKSHAKYAHLESPREINGKTDFDLWPKELAEKYRADDAEVMASRRQKHIEEPSFDGDKMHWVETFKTPVIDENGNVLGTTGFARDITERKQAELALAESEGRFREIFNTVSDAIFIHDAETGRIVDVNRRMCEMYGLTHEEALACGPDDLSAGVPPYSSAEAIKKIHLAYSEGPQTFDWLARARDGHFFWVEVSLQFAHIGSQHRILAVVRDISERKHMDMELRIAAIAFESQDGIVVTNADNIILRVNRAFTGITGYTAEEAIGHTPSIFKSGRHDADFYAAMWASIRLAGAWHGEIWNRRKNGEIYPQRLTITAVKGDTGETTNYVATLRDITEQKRVKEALQESEALLQATMKILPLGLWIMNAEGKIVFGNTVGQQIWAGARYVGIEQFGEYKGWWRDSGKRIEPHEWSAARAIEKGEISIEEEIEIECFDGTHKIILNSSLPLRRSDGSISGAIIVNQDITERKQTEEQIRHLAFYDTLTQLPNRRLLNDRIGQTMAASKRSGHYSALMFLDLDNFKPLNDTHGHDVGDLLLVEVAHRLTSCVREVDTVARFGGDEFVVMLSELDADNAESTAQARTVAEKIRSTLAEPYVLKFQQEGNAETIVEHHCTSSIGVVLFINHEASAEDILKWADMAMYQAKADGRNLTRFFDPES
ncbi:MAG: PAS domain S-box protein, partial [Gallionella sp.]|nr:PAS domain S-box protein [Gallionella sp.]